MVKKKKAKKLLGWSKFDKMTRALVEVPKGEVDRQVAKSRADRLRRKKGKRK